MSKVQGRRDCHFSVDVVESFERKKESSCLQIFQKNVSTFQFPPETERMNIFNAVKFTIEPLLECANCKQRNSLILWSCPFCKKVFCPNHLTLNHPNIHGECMNNTFPLWKLSNCADPLVVEDWEELSKLSRAFQSKSFSEYDTESKFAIMKTCSEGGNMWKNEQKLNKDTPRVCETILQWVLGSLTEAEKSERTLTDFDALSHHSNDNLFKIGTFNNLDKSLMYHTLGGISQGVNSIAHVTWDLSAIREKTGHFFTKLSGHVQPVSGHASGHSYRFSIMLDENVVWETKFLQSSQSEFFEISISNGKLLSLRAQASGKGYLVYWLAPNLSY